MSSNKKSGRRFVSAEIKREQYISIAMPYVPYLATFLVMWLLYFHLYSKGLLYNEAAISLCIRTVLLILVFCGIYLKYENKLTMDQLIMLCILGGLVMRMGYTFYTPFYVREHDIGEISLNGVGHAAYIYNLFENNKLPDSYLGQFYHPPLFHYLATISMKFFATMSHETEIDSILLAAALVSCFASCSVLFLVRSLCRELKCKPEMTCMIVAFVAFCPNFYLIAGCVNNDSVAVALIVFSFTMLVRWYYSRKFSHLIGMATGIGFGMMAKLNAAVLAFVAGPIMLYILWQAIRQKKWIGLLGQYFAFIAVCAPLGLWYSIRNYILFRMPFGYVLNVDYIEELYRGDVSYVKRFLSFPWKEFLSSPYCNSSIDYNLPIYMIRSSLFGEYQFDGMETIAWLLIFVNLFLIILSLVAMIAVVLKGKKFDPILRYGCAMLWLAFVSSYLVFNIKYPDSCTMDFRYIIPVIISGATYLAAFWQMMCEYLKERVCVEKSHEIKYYMAKVLVWTIPFCCILFALFSAYMYSNLA